jgi:hypothetical protein
MGRASSLRRKKRNGVKAGMAAGTRTTRIALKSPSRPSGICTAKWQDTERSVHSLIADIVAAG